MTVVEHPPQIRLVLVLLDHQTLAFQGFSDHLQHTRVAVATGA